MCTASSFDQNDAKEKKGKFGSKGETTNSLKYESIISPFCRTDITLSEKVRLAKLVFFAVCACSDQY